MIPGRSYVSSVIPLLFWEVPKDMVDERLKCRKCSHVGLIKIDDSLCPICDTALADGETWKRSTSIRHIGQFPWHALTGLTTDSGCVPDRTKSEERSPLDESAQYREYRRRLATTFPDCPVCRGTGVLAGYLWSSSCARCFHTGKVFSLDSF